MKDALSLLGYSPGPNNYQRLKEACERYSLRYPRASRHRAHPGSTDRPKGRLQDREKLKTALEENEHARGVLITLGLSVAGKNYSALTRACHFYGLTPPPRATRGRQATEYSVRFGSREGFIQAVEGASSITEVLTRLRRHPTDWGWVKAASLHHRVELPNWRRAISDGRRRRPLESILVERSTFRDNQSLKRRLVEEGLLVDECRECGLGPTWNGKPITLQLEHINGINNDNRIENLAVLCPNCHSQTDTYTGRNVSRREAVAVPSSG